MPHVSHPPQPPHMGRRRQQPRRGPQLPQPPQPALGAENHIQRSADEIGDGPDPACDGRQNPWATKVTAVAIPGTAARPFAAARRSGDSAVRATGAVMMPGVVMPAGGSAVGRRVVTRRGYPRLSQARGTGQQTDGCTQTTQCLDLHGSFPLPTFDSVRMAFPSLGTHPWPTDRHAVRPPTQSMIEPLRSAGTAESKWTVNPLQNRRTAWLHQSPSVAA